MKKHNNQKLDKNFILNLIKSGYTRKQISEECNCSIHIIKRFLKINNIKIIKYEPKTYRENLIKNEHKILEFYKKTNSLQKTANHFNTTRGALTDFFKKINFHYKTNNHECLDFEIETIKTLYYKNNKTLQEISKIYNCSYPKIYYLLKKNGGVIKNKNDILKERNKSEEFQRKCLSNSGKNKEYILPSGKTIKLRGYEPNFLDYIFNNDILKESDIIFHPSRIVYNYKNKDYYYYPDFFIPKLNLIVETKSSWILKKQGEYKTIQKEKAVITEGYNFLLIIDNNFDKLRTYIKLN
jgi:DNA-binding CsgD family transcriptional regulator